MFRTKPNLFYTNSSTGHPAYAAATVLIALTFSFLIPPSAQAQSFDLFYTFNGVVGANPRGNSLLDSLGNLYGTTSNGGSNLEGTVFKVSPSGKATRLYSFTGGPDGRGPAAGMIADANGNLYGTATSGGYTGGICGGARSGCGVIYEVSTTGQETVLYAFRGGADGDSPYHELVRDTAGNLYGNTEWGGVFGGPCGTLGCGVVFKLDPSGNETVLYAFTGASDGAHPNSPLILDGSGNLYGTTSAGGNRSGSVCQPYKGCGVIFKIDSAGNETVLYPFTGGSDGGFPWAVIADASGNFYGCTEVGAASDHGTVFELSAASQFSVLYSFSSHGVDFGCGGLVRASDGTLYGTTNYASGTIFTLDTRGHYNVLHRFNTPADGTTPNVPTLDSQANLWGTTAYGGNPKCGECGVVYKITP